MGLSHNIFLTWHMKSKFWRLNLRLSDLLKETGLFFCTMHFSKIYFCLLNSQGQNLSRASHNLRPSAVFHSPEENHFMKMSLSLMKPSNFHRKSGTDFTLFWEDKVSMCPPAQCVCIKAKVSAAVNTWGHKYQ